MNKEIQRLLLSKSQGDVSKGIELFSKKGSLKELPLILDTLESEFVENIENRIIETVSNVKVKDANRIIIDSILKAKEENGNLRALMQICWQSSLNFTQHLELFTDIFIVGDYLTALESFTVIENIWEDYSYNEDHRELLLNNIKNNIAQMDENKALLAKELILILS